MRFGRGMPTKKGVQPVALQQLLWLWVLWVQLWVLLPLFWLQLLWPPDICQGACTADTNGKGRARERTLPETVEYVDNLGEVSDSCSSLSSFGSISMDASSSSGITVSDEESGTDSESDSE